MMVGFDLDMTLADTRRGIGAVYREISERTGVFIDVPLVQGRLGPPLEAELAHWFPPGEILAMATLFRSLYSDLALPATAELPGARAAMRAVHAHGGQTMVVTAKNQLHADATIEFLDLDVDVVVGGLWSSAKGAALREHGAVTYVGDHKGDVDAARTAGAFSLGVATGPFTAAELLAYGADLVLPDLLAFPGWLTSK